MSTPPPGASAALKNFTMDHMSRVDTDCKNRAMPKEDILQKAKSIGDY
tara:strand:- start:2086 stop:2229 length:144 start_codon:yes stop_codon:yes gene_type:complete